MKQPDEIEDLSRDWRGSPYDPEEVPEDDLWFLPAPEAEEAPSAMPWPAAAREGGLAPEAWRAAEAAQYRALLSATQAVTRFGERLGQMAACVAERFALTSVSAVMRSEGIWIGEERIALYRAMRVAGNDHARDLSRASWAVRRLIAGAGGAGDPRAGLHGFLGRAAVSDPRIVPGDERVVGADLDALGDRWTAALAGLGDSHPLTVAAYGFALWRAEGITPYDDVLEPTVAAMRLGADPKTVGAPFLPMSPGRRFDRHDLTRGAARAEDRLAVFYRAVEAGALHALLELDRLRSWQARATAATRDLSGRTPPRLIEALMRFPVVSADLVAEATGCSAVSARRNLALFQDRGLVREVTGQERFRFWALVA